MYMCLSVCLCVCLSRYCPECKVDSSEVVLAGERLKESKKKTKMASAQSATSRDWGKVIDRLSVHVYLASLRLNRVDFECMLDR